MHSPWGFIYSVVEKTGYSWDKILWGISWVNLNLMIADAPQVKSRPKSEKVTVLEDEDDFKEFFKL